LDDLIELKQSHIQQVVFGTMVQQHSQAFGANKLKDSLTLLKLPLKSLGLHHISRGEQGFSKLAEIKTKKRSRLACENYMRMTLSKTKPSISQIASKRQ